MARMDGARRGSNLRVGRACDARETLIRLVGRDCSIDLLIDDIREELRERPYELISVAGGWQYRTRAQFVDAIHGATGIEQQGRSLSQADLLVLAIIAYRQPITRGELSKTPARRSAAVRSRTCALLASSPPGRGAHSRARPPRW